MIDEWSRVSAMFDRITAAARNLQRERRARLPVGESPTDPAPDDGWLDRTLDNCRADALAELVLDDDDIGSAGEAGSAGPAGHPSPGPSEGPPGRRRPVRRRGHPRIEGRLVIDLATLRGEADNPCLLDGSPVPARVGRRLARDIGHWRRMVTDPVDGHLLDFGRRVYLPESLRRFVLERDQVCRNPWCDQPAMRGQLDHAVEFPEGPSDAANTGALCVDCHRLKTARLAFLDRSAADGSAVWRTAWGQIVRVAPRAVLPVGGSLAGVQDRNADVPRRPRPVPVSVHLDVPPF